MAKKSKAFDELLYQQRWASASEKSFQKLEKNINRDSGKKIQVVRNAPDIVKMSDVLREFVRPYINDAKNKRELQTLFEMAASAWNLAVMPEEERISRLDKLLAKKQKNSDVSMSIELLEAFMRRKQKYFKDNHRMIMDFQVEYLGQGEYHLSVASTPPKPAIE